MLLVLYYIRGFSEESISEILFTPSVETPYLELDLDQLNHILGVLGSPSQEDLNCIINDKVPELVEVSRKTPIVILELLCFLLKTSSNHFTC